MNRMKAYFVVGIIMFLLLIPFKCFSQTNVSLEQVQSMRENLVTEAKKYVGSPYIRGATGPNSFDCSGLVFYVARESIQVQLPRTVKAMYGFVKGKIYKAYEIRGAFPNKHEMISVVDDFGEEYAYPRDWFEIID